MVSGQNPVTIYDYSEPEPDVVVAKFREDIYSKQHPQPEDVQLIIEVADSSLAYDRNAKISLYAAAGVPEAWLVDLAQAQIHVFRLPDGVDFADKQSYKAGDCLPIPGFEDLRISISELGL